MHHAALHLSVVEMQACPKRAANAPRSIPQLRCKATAVRWMYPHRSRQAARDEGRKPTSDSAQHSLADSTP
jgi:hypothetical protein